MEIRRPKLRIGETVAIPIEMLRVAEEAECSQGCPTDLVPDPEVEIVQRAAEVLGPQQVARWLKMEVASLNHRTPLSLIATEEGRAEVERVLGQIEHGVF